MTRHQRWATMAISATAIIVVAAYTVLAVLWQNRPDISDLDWPVVDADSEIEGQVTATWLGISTLLFDDGETQVLIDGTFTRLSPLYFAFARPVASDIATINYVMDEYRIDRLAALVPVHTHVDHAIDVGRVANRSTALLLGTESMANIALGADVPVDQFQILASGESRVFGDFTITLIESRHVPTGPGDGGWPTGVIDTPLRQPARFWAWRGGTANSILIRHPSGTALVQGSAGFVDGALATHAVDVAFVSVAGLAAQGEDYTRQYWEQTVGATGAGRVIPIHFDDFTRPFGEVALFPYIADDVLAAAPWISALAEESGARLERPPFGVSMVLY